MRGKSKLFYFTLFLAASQASYSQANTTYQKLTEVAIKLNKSMPRTLDKYTRVDSLKAIAPDTFQYFVTLFHVNKTMQSLNKIKQIMQTKMLDSVRVQKEFKPYRDNKIKIVYRYYDEDKSFLFAIFLTPEKYLH